MPGILSIDGPLGYHGDEIYFNEHDGTKMSDLAPALIDQLPQGAKIESNGRNEAWISHWDDEALAKLDGRVFEIRFSQVSEIDERGEETWLEDRADLLPVKI